MLPGREANEALLEPLPRLCAKAGAQGGPQLLEPPREGGKIRPPGAWETTGRGNGTFSGHEGARRAQHQFGVFRGVSLGALQPQTLAQSARKILSKENDDESRGKCLTSAWQKWRKVLTLD